MFLNSLSSSCFAFGISSSADFQSLYYSLIARLCLKAKLTSIKVESYGPNIGSKSLLLEIEPYLFIDSLLKELLGVVWGRGSGLMPLT